MGTTLKGNNSLRPQLLKERIRSRREQFSFPYGWENNIITLAVGDHHEINAYVITRVRTCVYGTMPT